MTNSNYVNVQELLHIAIRFEIDSAEFYGRMQEKAPNKNVSETLKMLERQEREHEKLLRRFETETNTDPNAMLQFPPDLSLAMPELKQENPGMKELVDHALEREIQSRNIYHNAAAYTSGELKDLLEGLATFEDEHVDRVKSLKRFV